MKIIVDDLNDPEIRELLQEHLQSMARYSPPESIHALDLPRLRQPEITFWTVWQDHELLGCGALKQLDAGHGEIKSMRTATRHLRKGVARHLLRHILDEARCRGYQRISLETGSQEAFGPARALYEGFGFRFCEPFGDYREDRNSVFLSLVL